MEEEEEGPLRREISHSPCHPYLPPLSPPPQGQWKEGGGGELFWQRRLKKVFFFANCDFNKVGKFDKKSPIGPKSHTQIYAQISDCKKPFLGSFLSLPTMPR